MSAVLDSLAASFYPSITDDIALSFQADKESLRTYANKKKGMLFLNPAKKPMTIRADIIDSCDNRTDDFYPLLTHFGIRPSAYAYSGKPEYQRALKRFVKFRHLISLKARLSAEDKQTLAGYEERLRQLKAECKVKRDATISINSRGFFETGLYPDMVQHSMFLILSCFHVRFHWSLEEFEEKRIKYKFKDKAILELALTHPSYRANYGTNPDHAKNTLNNCGIRWTKAQTSETTDGKSGLGRKRGINALMEIMAKQSSNDGAKSAVKHNERLEFLGDAVVEFITTVHLFFVFQYLEEGGLATYRSSIVQNKHLAFLAKKIGLHEFMLYAHGPDLCHESDLRHAMANAFEALMAALLLDSDINECDRIFSETLFGDDPRLFKVWKNLAEHPLKKDNPYGDRHLIDTVPCLQLLTMFENNIGIRFKHIRLLAKAFTRRNVAFNYLTLGHNQRLEFLGDTVLQLITTEYLYKHFPHHQEGHLSLLRTCLVSNKTQSVICDDLAMQKYVVVPKAMKRRANYASTITLLRVKDKADLVEAFLGALYVDRGLEYCRTFCQVCFFPRLKHFILTQKWNDPKSQLQQCCLTLRQPTSGEPDIPEYKTIGVEGPTNTRVYRVAVYFRSKRLAEGVGGSVQLAQMQAAENALSENATLFPSFNLYAPSNNSDAPNSMQQQKQVRNDTFKAPSVKRRYTPNSTVREMNHTPRRNYKPSSSLSSYSSFTSRNIPRTSGTLFRIRSLSRESTPKSAHAKLSSLNRKKPILK
ncbi:ribonuclease-III-like domain-containing protein [Ditylenchus destructor]|nr:ribonuclease-III-like domain-containing protein [Ditylenchus destructor]